MTFTRFVFCFSIGAMLLGCTVQYTKDTLDRLATVSEIKAHYDIQRLRPVGLSANHFACAAAPAIDDVAFQKKLEQTLHTSLQYYFFEAIGVENAESQQGALRQARSDRCDLLFFLTLNKKTDKVWSLTDWAEAETEWSDIGPDRLELRVSVWDVNSRQLLDMAVIRSRTAWLDLYASHSEDLIQASLHHYLHQLVVLR